MNRLRRFALIVILSPVAAIAAPITGADLDPMEPAALLLELFEENQVVFLGEYHRVADQIEQVALLLPALYAGGIRFMGWEFCRAEDQKDIDRLLLADHFDEELADELIFRFDPFFGYVEYRDVYRAAWEINARRSEGEPAFRILGIRSSPDWSHVREPGDEQDPEILARVHADGDVDDFMARSVIEKLVDPGHKALVYCGQYHAMTAYRQPILRDGEFQQFVRPRLGNQVDKALQGRAATVLFHMAWIARAGWEAPEVRPADGQLTDAIAASWPSRGSFGFRADGAAGRATCDTAFLSYGYESLTLADVCDGVIVTAPLEGIRPCTPIIGMFTADNLDRTKRQARNPRFKRDTVTAFHFLRILMREAQGPRRRWEHLWSGNDR